MWSRILFVIATLLFCQAAQASVVMTGTRVIYPAEVKEKSIQLANNDGFPNVVQLWTDTNNPQSTPENADGPFIVLPAIAKIKANSGQTFRLIYTGESLPSDRESVFYLNFLQIPPAEKANSGENKMLIMLRNRLKIFYRPDSLNVAASELPNLIDFNVMSQAQGLRVEVENKSPYFASFTQGSLNYQAGDISLPVEMVAPFSKVVWSVNDVNLVPQTQARINFTLVNDLGASVMKERAVVIR